MLGSFWDHFGIILGLFWNHFGIILGSCWDHFGIILGQFWNHVGIIFFGFFIGGTKFSSSGEPGSSGWGTAPPNIHNTILYPNSKNPKGKPGWGKMLLNFRNGLTIVSIFPLFLKLFDMKVMQNLEKKSEKFKLSFPRIFGTS